MEKTIYGTLGRITRNAALLGGEYHKAWGNHATADLSTAPTASVSRMPHGASNAGGVRVDHALSRAECGLAGYLIVEGPENLEIFNAPPNENDSGH